MSKGIPHFSRTCDTHNLFFATALLPSADGTRVYLVCSCGARRAVSAVVWEAEQARRQKAASDQELRPQGV